MSNIAIIPARGGSKRIPNKNVKDFLGKPIITYSIRAAIDSELFDEVMVSTDDMAIAEIALENGAKVPFMRSPETSDDYATTADVLNEVILKYKETNINFEYACCIYATAPLVSVNKLIESYNLMISSGYDSVVPVIPFSFPVQRGLKMPNSHLEFVYPEHINSRSQDLETIYHDAGQYYFFQVENFLESKKIWTANTGGTIISELEAQDIDNIVDWKLAEMKFKLRNEISYQI